MKLEIQDGKSDKNPEFAGFCVDFQKKDIGLIEKENSIAIGEAIRSKGDSSIIELEAKRPGPKSSAQTPSKPSEKKEGSSKNKPGSAAEKSSDAISFSNKVIEALKNKVKEHNSKHSRKVSLSQLKKIYRRG